MKWKKDWWSTQVKGVILNCPWIIASRIMAPKGWRGVFLSNRWHSLTEACPFHFGLVEWPSYNTKPFQIIPPYLLYLLSWISTGPTLMLVTPTTRELVFPFQTYFMRLISNSVTPHTSTYRRIGSPTPSISGMTHLRSNAFAKTILNIFCTFIEAAVEQNIRDACMALANRLDWNSVVRQKSSGGVEGGVGTCLVISSCSSRGKVANVSNLVPIKKGMAV